jgi:murein L,D-transpeptidase YcbB/YkuD
VAALKKRFAATGDYPAGDTSNVYNDSLGLAIRAMQEQFGLVPTGQVNDSLLRELNVPAEERVQQILVNMNRAIWIQPLQDSSVIFVNIPSQELVVYGDTAKLMTMPVVVGREGSSTIAFNDATRPRIPPQTQHGSSGSERQHSEGAAAARPR